MPRQNAVTCALHPERVESTGLSAGTGAEQVPPGLEALTMSLTDPNSAPSSTRAPPGPGCDPDCLPLNPQSQEQHWAQETSSINAYGVTAWWAEDVSE